MAVAAGGIFDMGVSMAMEQNGAGKQGAAGRCGEAAQGYGGEGLRVLGQRARLLPRQMGRETPEPLRWGWPQDQ